MRKTFFTLFVAFFTISGSASAQTLFTIDKDSFSVPQFVAAYQKNSAAPAAGANGFKEYFPLYIASKLKIKEAKNLGLDTLPQLVAEVENLRQQIIPSYLVPDKEVDKLVAEAFLRSQKDIYLAHIFIASGTDSLTAKQRAAEAYQRAQKGVRFSEVAKQFSDDPSAKINGGDVGFITVFTLPYTLENLIYTTPVGKVSPVYHSKNGYHIFLNKKERKAIGEMNAAQILIAFPPGATDSDKSKSKALVDSLYNSIQKGDDFSLLAKAFSNDVSSAPFGGVLPPFSTGQYESVFENAVYALQNGQVSKPFATQYGWHIIQRINSLPVPAILNQTAAQFLREKVVQTDRINTIKEAQVQRVISEAPLSPLTVNGAELWSYTESAVNFQSAAPPAGANKHLFLIGIEPVTLLEWITFAQENRSATEPEHRPFSYLFWNNFIPQKAFDYYQAHLENFNPDFKDQIEELKEGSLFFEVMQQQVWAPAQKDTAALFEYFTKHQLDYTWNKSADAITFYASDVATAKEVKKAIEKAPKNWREVVAQWSEKVAADSARFNWEAIPDSAKKPLKKGTVTAPVVNNTDSSASFAYIVNLYNNPQPRSFLQAKGLVISDYQAALEKTWVEQLKKKHTVTINQKAWDDLLKQQ